VPIARETLVETLSDGIMVLDTQNRIQDINKAALSFLGITNKNIIGYQAELSGASVIPLLNAAIDHESIDLIEMSDNNEIKSFRVLKNAIKNQRGSRLVVIRDITDSKRAEEALKESEIKYRGLAENSPDAIAIYVKGKIVFVNNECLRLMAAATPEELIGKSVIEFVHPDYRALVAERMSKVVSEGTVLPLAEEKFVRLDGSEVEVEVKAMSIRFGNKLAVQLIIRDITERKQAEQKLIKAKELAEESDRLKSAFLANMSHEIRTPMNNILGFTDLLKMDDLTSKQQKEYIQIIKKGGDRLLNIINDIIDISKIESGQMKVSVTKTNINEQIEYISSFFRPEAEEKGIRLIFKNTLLSQDAIINTDREKIFAILINLVKNAIKFTSEGFIEFGYRKKEMLLEFFVKDTGTGIRQEHKELIFERFRQGSESLARNYEGAGLGLSISKAYVEMLGGKIRVDSEPGKGSVFYFTIPYNPDKMPETVIENKVNSDFKEHQIKRLKILIAEDDEASGLLITNIVKAYCKTELKVKTGIEAVEACQANPDIDLILMDIKMPEMDGYEATRQIRQFNKDVIIIAQTAFALTGDKERALQAGCNDYISKPIDGNLLMEIIQKHFKK
jgi:PAS domain S-box-containing protein